MVPSNPDGSDFSLLSPSARSRLQALFFHLATVDIKAGTGPNHWVFSINRAVLY